MAAGDGATGQVPRDWLEPGEEILWQGRPEFAGLVPPTQFALLMAIEAVPLGLLLLALVSGEWRVLPAALVLAAVVGLFLAAQLRFAARTAYVLTNRRAVTLTAGRVSRQDTPASMPVLELNTRGSTTHGDIVFRWIVTNNRKGGTRRTPEGFLALRDPAPVLERLRSWGMERAAENAGTLRGYLAAGGKDAGMPGGSGHGRVFAAPGLGIALRIPADWRVEVARIPTTGLLRPEPGWEDPAVAAPGWNAIAIRSPAAPAVLEVTVAEGPLPLTFEQVRDEPWARRLGLVPLRAEPEIRIGPWRGFSIAHALRGGGAFGLLRADAPVLQRQVWLDAPPRHIHARMAAEEGAVDLQHALDAMLGTLRPA